MDSIRRFGWAPLAVLGLHILGSKVLGAYAAFPDLDVPMHVLGGMAIGYFFWRSAITAHGQIALGSLGLGGRAVLSAALTATSTLVWECAEWTGDRLGFTSAQAGLDDTMLDMVVGALGGVAVIIVGSLRGRTSRPRSDGSDPGRTT